MIIKTISRTISRTIGGMSYTNLSATAELEPDEKLSDAAIKLDAELRKALNLIEYPPYTGDPTTLPF